MLAVVVVGKDRQDCARQDVSRRRADAPRWSALIVVHSGCVESVIEWDKLKNAAT